MNYNENMTEALAVLGQLASAVQTVAAHAIGPFNMANFRKVLFIVDLGALGTSATVDFKVQAEPTNGGTATDITGAAITQITAGATSLLLVEVRAETVEALGLGPWIKGVLTVGVAASAASVVALGAIARYKPESDYNVVAPTQVVVA